ncbi:MAG: Fis family transcriptional regulator, partial [Deltaproteobacteria bacterium]|nr:Fis family transcriptional regulator [Deltaproteobacteria bacterium]
IIEYGTVVCKNSLIRIKNLPEHLLRVPDSKNNTVTKETSEKVFSIESMEKNVILETLRKNNWNRKASAAQMGIHPSTLWRKIKRLNLKIPEQDGRSKNK